MEKSNYLMRATMSIAFAHSKYPVQISLPSVKKALLFCFLSCMGALAGRAQQWATNGTSIYNTNSGNVGIGTSSPTSNLTIVTSAGDGVQLNYGTAGFVRLTGNSMPSGYLNPMTKNGDAALIFGQSAVDNITTGLVIAPFRSFLSGLRIDSVGNVGVKTNNTQGYALAVNGSAIFTSAYVKPYANWPDYVFEKEYSLPPLDSLSAYIQLNHHLPDVPSAESVQQKGLELGGSQVILLKKIEELTLYLIDQQKEFESLKIHTSQVAAENDRLKKECNELFEQVKASRQLMDRVEKLEACVKEQLKLKTVTK